MVNTRQLRTLRATHIQQQHGFTVLSNQHNNIKHLEGMYKFCLTLWVSFSDIFVYESTRAFIGENIAD